MEEKCPICDGPKKEQNKFCSYACRNVFINSRKDYKKQSLKSSETLKKKFDELRSEKTVNCEKCNEEFVVKSVTDGSFKDKYWCSERCSKSRTWTDADKLIKSNAAKNSAAVLTENKSRRKKTEKQCETCGTVTLRKRWCKKECRPKSSTPEAYRAEAKFMFSLNLYPEEFDFDLIRKYGWYKAINRGNNFEGVSRDHLYSVSEGYKNGVDPKILSHPANCQLMVHRENISKNKTSSITLDELLKRITDWDKKYPQH